MGQEKQNKKNQLKQLKNHQDRVVCAKASGQLWACQTQIIHSPVPWVLRYCFLTILKHFNWCTVYSTKCLLFICKYLFIYYLFGLWFWMHIYAYILYSMLLSLMWRLYCYSNLAKIYFSVLSLSEVFFFSFDISTIKIIVSHTNKKMQGKWVVTYLTDSQ